jgi:hypothetical protein
MLTYIKHIFTNLGSYSKKLDDITIFQNQNWINIDEIGIRKKLFIFRPENKLLVSVNGNVNRGVWEYIDSTTILVDIDNDPVLLRHAFIDDEFLLLNQDNTENYALFIKENDKLKGLNTIEQINFYLENKYRLGLPKEHEIYYKIINQIDEFDLAWGNYTRFEVIFNNENLIYDFYKGNDSQRFFYVKPHSNERKYFDNLKDAIDFYHQKYC